jgi:hypothetical protein
MGLNTSGISQGSVLGHSLMIIIRAAREPRRENCDFGRVP